MIDTGDTVFHRPTREEWLVACVVEDRLSWMGWPEGSANVADCTLVEKASPEKRRATLEQIAACSGDDHRVRFARHILEKERS
jgi:hypothetical protein